MAAVIHLAGLHDSWAPRAQDFFEANVDGACHVRDDCAASLFSQTASTLMPGCASSATSPLR